MKYLQIFENTPVVNNNTVKFTSKNEKLDQIKEEINTILSTICDKKICYNYATGSKGIFFTDSKGDLLTTNGFACTTYSEILSNLEAILFSLKNINTNGIIAEKPVEVLPPDEPTSEIMPTIDSIPEGEPVIIPIIQSAVDSFESFKNKLS